MNTTIALKLSTTPSYRQRSLVALASLLITVAVLAGNLGLARGYASTVPVGIDSAQAATPARA